MSASFHINVSWRVLSTRKGACDAGYWTSSYENKYDAVHHAGEMEGQAYEVTSEFMYEGTKLVGHVSETWRLLL